MLSALYAIAHPYVTRVDQSKMVEVGIIKLMKRATQLQVTTS